MTANRAASIRARLKQHTDTSKQDFNLTLTRYGLERLLYRLSVSEHAPNFLLKGALLFQLWYGQPHRPTRDADLLVFGPDDVPTLIGVFRSVCRIEVDDGIAADAAKQVQWKAFLRKNKIDAIDLADVGRYVRGRAMQCGIASA